MGVDGQRVVGWRVDVLTTQRKEQMLVYVVLWQGILIGLYTCATDAAVASKPLDSSTVIT